MPLEDHYIGDKAFYEFASIQNTELDIEFGAYEHQQELINLCNGDKLLARAIFYVSGCYAIDYMHRPIPALEGLSPIECMKTQKGQDRLKENILRTP